MAEQHTDDRIESSAGSVQRRKRVSTARLLLYLSLFLALMLVGLRLVPEVMLMRTVSQIRAAGYPTDLQGFIAQFAPPMEGVNGEPILREAAGLMVDPATVLWGTVNVSDELRATLNIPASLTNVARADLIPRLGMYGESPPLGEPWPEEMIDAMRDFVLANQGAIDKIFEAREADYFFRDEVRTSTDVDQYVGLNLGNSRRLTNLLYTVAALAIAEGRVEDALEALDAFSVVTRPQIEMPSLGGRLIEISFRHLYFNRASELMSSLSLTEPQLERLRDVIQEIDITEGLDAALLLETPALISVDLPKLMEYQGIDRWKIRLWKYSGYFSLSRSIMLKDQLDWQESIRRPIDEWRLPHTSRWHQDIPDYLNTARYLVWSEESLERTERSFFATEIRRRAALAAIGVERYLREHGRLPDRLNDLVPDFLDAVPLNPALGTPLEFVVRDDRYFIFGSVDSHPVPNPIERRYDRQFDLGPVDIGWGPEPIEQDDFGHWGLRGQGPDQQDDLGHWTLRVQGPHRPFGFTVRFAGRDE